MRYPKTQQLLALLFSHSVVVELVTSHIGYKSNYNSKIVYDRELCSKSSITADTASRKDLTLQGCTKVLTRTYTLVVESGRYKITKHTPNGMSTGFQTRRFLDPKQARGATPLSYPQRSRPVSEMDSGFASMVVNDWEPETLGLVDTAKTLRLPKQYRCSSHNLN